MKQKKSYALLTSLALSCLLTAPAMADEATQTQPPSPQSSTTSPTKVEVKYFDCHYKGAKDSQDLKAKITKDGDKFYWTDNVGESGPLTISPDHTITLDYTYVAKNQEKISGKMTFKAKEDNSLEGTYADSFDSGTISCVEHKQ